MQYIPQDNEFKEVKVEVYEIVWGCLGIRITFNDIVWEQLFSEWLDPLFVFRKWLEELIVNEDATCENNCEGYFIVFHIWKHNNRDVFTISWYSDDYEPGEKIESVQVSFYISRIQFMREFYLAILKKDKERENNIEHWTGESFVDKLSKHLKKNRYETIEYLSGLPVDFLNRLIYLSEQDGFKSKTLDKINEFESMIMESILINHNMIEDVLDKANPVMDYPIDNGPPILVNELYEYKETFTAEFDALSQSEKINFLYDKFSNNSYSFTAVKLIYLRTAFLDDFLGIEEAMWM